MRYMTAFLLVLAGATAAYFHSDIAAGLGRQGQVIDSGHSLAFISFFLAWLFWPRETRPTPK